jgi:hypothetical protein
MIRTLFLIVCLTFTGILIHGQSGRNRSSGADILKNLQDHEVSDQLNIEVDSLLVANYYKLAASNSMVKGVPGYRIRIYSESGLGAKEEQQRVRAKFISLYPGIDAYHAYDEPFFKVYVGDCRTKSEAVKLYDKVKRNFPYPFIVEDYINLKSSD